MMSVGFEKVYLLYNSAVYETADVIQTYVYRQGIQSNNYSYEIPMIAATKIMELKPKLCHEPDTT